MTNRMKVAGVSILMIGTLLAQAQQSVTTTTKATTTTKTRKTVRKTHVESETARQIRELREAQAAQQAQMSAQQTQIDALTRGNAAKDAALAQAQEAARTAAEQARVAIAQAQAATVQAQSANTSAQANSVAVQTLKTDIGTRQTASSSSAGSPKPTEPGAPAIIAKTPVAPPINAALAPIRPFPVGSLKVNESPAFKSNGVGITPYGFIKLTLVEDSSSPNGDDFPLPGFLTDTAPNGSPEFHVKARGTRLGTDVQWFDSSKKWVFTGKIEADFEGNFNRSDNRNISSARSSNPSLRLAWVRTDYNFDAKNSVSAVFGQDWTTFGSSTLPNILETTGLGIGFGVLWERNPQARIGFTHKEKNFSIMPEFAIDMPVSGLTPSAANISNQLGYGERQGADSNRPQLEARIVGQWQLDKAAGVPPAQLIVSGFHGRRQADVLAAAIPAAYKATFARGATSSSPQNGADVEWQLPTRWITVIGKYYTGSDLRWFFAGQLFSVYNDTAGLTATATAASIDGASTIVLGTNASGQQVVAPSRPVRAAGGFIQVGLPLSRIFNANPTGRNAGWSIYGLYGEDQAKQRDINKFGGVRHKSTMEVGTLNYKLNRWLSFSYEQSLYTTYANPELSTLPLFRGVPSRQSRDLREEGGPIFTF